ncbi:MAG: RNA polymerase sigma factor [Steroidobacteraceae bacterium]
MVNSDSKDGSAGLLTDLVRRYGAQMERLVRQMVHDGDVAKHIVQETYLNAFRRFQRTSAPPVLYAKTYLFDACITNAINYLQRDRSSPESAQNAIEAEDVPDGAPGPQKLALLEDALAHVGKILEELPLKQRQVFRLGQIDGVPRRQVAQQLGLSEKSVTNLTTRVLANLRMRLAERGFDSVLDIDDDGSPQK